MTGMRIGEAAALQWSDIDFETGILSIDKNLYYKSMEEYKFVEPKTQASVRDIVIDADTIKELEEWKEVQQKVLTDYDFVVTHPHGYELDPSFVGNVKVEYDQAKAFEGADFIYAKNWSAYTDPNYGKVLSTDRSWTVDASKMALTDNAFFMHCLPVRRNMIVTDEVIESERSIVIPEAANREISAQTVLKRILEDL